MRDQSNSILPLCDPIFQIMEPFFESEGTKSVPDDFRYQIEGAFSTLEQGMKQLCLSAERRESATYALAALMDEVVLTSSWIGREKWMRNTLQIKYFGEHLAGENFFDRLERLRRQGLAVLDLLELYYVCLAMGFEGRYRHVRGEELSTIKNTLLEEISQLRGRSQRALSPCGVSNMSEVEQASQRLPLWVIGSVTAFLLLVIHLGYVIFVNKVTNHAVREVNWSRQELVSMLRGKGL